MKLLGFVDWENVDRGGRRIAGVTPLFEIVAPTWRAVSAEEFPTQGKVFWFQASAEKDALIYFRVEENTGEFKDQFKVAEPQFAIEVLDLRTIGSPEEVRQSFSAGLRRTGFVPRRALLWCEDDLFIGPVNIHASGTDTYTFEHPQRHKINCYSRKLDVREISYGRTLRYVVADISLGPPDSFVDWDEDKVVIRRAISWAIDRAKERGDELGLTRNLVQQAAAQLTMAGSSAELKLERYRLQRAAEIIADRSLSEDIAQSAVEALQSHPVIVDQLNQLREQIKKAVTNEVNESLAAGRAALEEAKQQKEQIQSEIEAANSELEDLQTQIDSKVLAVDDEVNRRIGEILEKPAALLAEVAILQAVLQSTNHSTTDSGDSPLTKNPHPIAWTKSSKIISDQTELRKSLVASYKASGVPVKVGGRVHSALRAGLMPILAGPRSLKALEAYARIVCGGRMFRVNVAPSYLDPGDLFGKFDTDHSRFLPHPAGLVDVLENARQTHGYALVVIEGANRAPTESYLLPILQCAFGNFNLQLLHPSLISPEAAYRDLAEIRWPSNVLLSASIVEGATTLPLCRDLWNAAVLVDTDGETPKPSAVPDVVELDPESGLMRVEPPIEGEADYFEMLPGYEALRESSERYLSALSNFEGDQEKLVRALAESILLPFAASITDDEERGELLQPLTKMVSTVGLPTAELESLVRKIRRRIA